MAASWRMTKTILSLYCLTERSLLPGLGGADPPKAKMIAKKSLRYGRCDPLPSAPVILCQDGIFQ